MNRNENREKLAAWQDGVASEKNPMQVCSFGYESIECPTRALLHQAARFLYFTKGTGILVVDGVQYKVTKHTLIAITPYEISEMIQVVEPLQFIKIVYDYTYVNYMLSSAIDSRTDISELFRLMSSQPCVCLTERQAEKVEEILSCLKEELGVDEEMEERRGSELSTIYTVNKLVELIVQYSRFFAKNNANYMDLEKDADALEVTQTRSIMSYIYAHSEENLTLSKLSSTFYMSESSIAKKIQEQTGLSFTEVLENMRKQRVSDYLLHTGLGIAEIAELTGYTDASYLTKRFTAHFGVTPAEYRKLHSVERREPRQDKELAYRVTEYLYENHAEEKLSKETVARQFDRSVHEINRSLLYYTGKSFDSLLNFIRVNKAAERLACSEDLILDIAIEVGYGCVKTFNLNFFKLRGMTPTQFRNAIVLQREDGREEGGPR